MNQKSTHDPEVEKILGCFDKIEPIKADPFFYTRLQNRLTSSAPDDLSHRAVRILRPALLMSLILLNIYTLFIYYDQPQQASTERTRMLNDFAQDFSLDITHYDANIDWN